MVYFLRKIQTLRGNNSKILRIQNAKFSGYHFYMNTNIWRDFQICINVPLIISFWALYDWCIMVLLNVLWMIVIIRTCYWYYNSNSLAIQQIGLKRNFLWRRAQIIASKIIQTDDKSWISWATSWISWRKYTKL